MAQIDRSFVGEGTIYARTYQSQAALLDIGNCDTFSVSYATNRTTLPNYRGGGGNRNVRESVTDVTATIGMYDLTPTNLARVVRGTIQVTEAAAITDEPLVCEGIAGELIPFATLPDTDETVTINAVGDPVVPLVAGVDYQLVPHGIIVKDASKFTPAGVTASYTPLPASVVQMLTAGQVELEIYVAGLNDAQSGEPFSVRARRAKFGLISELPVFGTEYLRLEAPVELLADDLVTDPGISKFCAMELVHKGS
ncbi:hypothetical protein HG264_04325 [Pseudomonas sp. gcc21]|uniref:phage tail tube protein n=1 Tax=Pseudomonas sp. gcc21 TaxID=2726989 RepID=UPI0014518BAA|nr:hypothetical protein [Pseudomonas sp. gcc21]QJD58196.1 hypothetical protein HG264_04325 [Pseudomonas sp. gcc21]